MITVVFVITQDGEGSASVINPVFPSRDATPLENDLAKRVSIAGAQALHAVSAKGSFNFTASGTDGVGTEQAGQVSDAVRRFGQEGA
jgi:hypothetical protein